MTQDLKKLESMISTIVEKIVREVIVEQFAPPLTRKQIQLIPPKFRTHCNEIHHILLKHLKMTDRDKAHKGINKDLKKLGLLAPTTHSVSWYYPLYSDLANKNQDQDE